MYLLAPQVGLEPTTLRLTVENSPRSVLLSIALYRALSMVCRRGKISLDCGDYPQFRTFLKEYTHKNTHIFHGLFSPLFLGHFAVQAENTSISHHKAGRTTSNALYIGDGLITLDKLMECVECVCTETVQWMQAEFKYTEAQRILRDVAAMRITPQISRSTPSRMSRIPRRARRARMNLRNYARPLQQRCTEG